MIDFIVEDIIENPKFNVDNFNEFLIISRDFKNSIEEISDFEDNSLVND